MCDVIFCHPDDEVIFLGPVFRQVLKPGCFTSVSCKSDVVRCAEFYEFMKARDINDFAIYDFPILRGWNFEFLVQYIKFFSQRKLSQKIVTHTIYGDEHHHPQHILLACALYIIAVREQKELICYGNQSFALKKLFQRTFSLDFRISKFFSLVVKLFLHVLFSVLFKKVNETSTPSDVKLSAMKCYSSQNLSYEIFDQNKYFAYQRRKLWKL